MDQNSSQSYQPLKRKKRLVVIGGGFAGTNIAKKLQSKFDVTLVDTNDYFEYTPGILRVLVEPGHSRKLRVKHEDYLRGTKIIVGKVREVSDSEVWVGERRIGFDYLVIASGSRYDYPIKEEDVFFAMRIKHLGKAYSKLVQAKRVCVVGGGLVGVELAAEISARGNRDITLIHSRDRLMERNDPKSRKYAENFLKKRGVKLVYNERAKEFRGGRLNTESGKKFGCDLVFFTVGIKSNFDFMKKNFSDKLHKGIKVNEYLQLLGKKNVFVAGDVSNIKEEKTAQNAEMQGEVVVKNVKAVEFGGSLEKYESRKRVMVISLGKWDGIIEYGGFVLPGKIAALLKWMIEKRWMGRYG